jgi:hypothetical protein
MVAEARAMTYADNTVFHKVKKTSIIVRHPNLMAHYSSTHTR